MSIVQRRYIWSPVLHLPLTEEFPWDDLLEILQVGEQMVMVQNGIETLPQFFTG